MTVFTWSTTASANASSDATINAREGMAPSGVNDSLRAMMAAIAKWRADMSGNLVTTGTATAYALTTNQVYTALTDGIAVAARIHADNGAAPTLNVDGLGARAIATVFGTAVGAGKLRNGGVYVFVYDSTDNKWIVHANPNDGFEAGTKILFQQTSAPTGWTKDTTHDNKALRVVSGTAGSGGTTAFTTVFASRTILEANLPVHTHGVGTLATASAGDHSHTTTGASNAIGSTSGGQSTAIASTVGTSTAGAHTHTITGATASTGSGTAMDFAVQYVDVIIATKD